MNLTLINEVDDRLTIQEIVDQLEFMWRTATQGITGESKIYFEIPYDGPKAYITGFKIINGEVKLSYEGNND